MTARERCVNVPECAISRCGDAPECAIAARVRGPKMPELGLMPWSFWNFATAASVFGPKMPGPVFTCACVM